jgi:carbonic anhydrase
MKKQLYFYIAISVITALALGFNSTALAAEKTNTTPDQALQLLMDGNKRYIEEKMVNTKQADTNVRKSLANTQKPYAVILACSDSRVPPEIIFDQGLGEIFVVRVAGNIITPEIIGSIEYAVEHLGSPLIMVLGHERCGAVTAAVNAHGKISGYIKSIIKALTPAVIKAKHEYGTKNKANLIEGTVDKNIQLIATNLPKKSNIIRNLVHEGKIKIVTAKYDLDSGVVHLVALVNIGAGKRTRTSGLLITNQLLYHLSYAGISELIRV